MSWPPHHIFISSLLLCHIQKSKANNFSFEVGAVCMGLVPKRDCMSLMIHVKLLAMSKCATRGALSQEINLNFPRKHNYPFNVQKARVQAL